MSTILFKRGTTSQLDQYVGKEGELVIDSENKTLRVFDGTNKGGYLIGGLDVIDGGVIPEPEITFVKRSDYNIYIVSVNDNVVFDPIMIWVRVNPNDSSKIQYWDETKDNDWTDTIRSAYDVNVIGTQSFEDVEQVINEIALYYSPSKDTSVVVPPSGAANSPIKGTETVELNTDEKVLLGYQDLGWTAIHKTSWPTPTYVKFNNITFKSFPSANYTNESQASNEIAFYQNVFEKNWKPN